MADSDLHGALLSIVMPARAEYEAPRRTAVIEVATGHHFLDMLEAVLAAFENDVLVERRRYNNRVVDLDEFWPWLQERCRVVFQALGYALGHADGVLHHPEVGAEVKAGYEARLQDLAALDPGWLIDETRSSVVPVYEQESWTSLSVFDPLTEVAEDLLESVGVFLTERPQGFHVDIPPGWDSGLV